MKRTDKKGFTIVELVIVIAVIAILAAVLIPNISRLVRKAQVSNDLSLVRNLNLALETESATMDYPTAYDAFAAVKENGYDIAKIEAKASNNKILYDEVNKCFVYLNGVNLEYYPNSKKGDTATPNHQLWAVVTSAEDAKKSQYSVYWNGGDGATVEVKDVGFDVGENKNVNVTVTAATQELTVRTNGGNMTIDSNGTVNHYGMIERGYLKKVASKSYHEFGVVTSYIKAEFGRIVVEPKASISIIAVESENVSIEQKSGSELFKVASTKEGVLDKANIKVLSDKTVDKTVISNLENLSYGGGEGTLNKPYQLYTAAHLVAFAKDVNNGKISGYVYATLCADVDISGMAWEPIGNAENPFYGAFDGQSHTVNGLTNKGYTPDQALFGTSSNAKNYGTAYGFFGVAGYKTGSDTTALKFSNLKFSNVDIDIDYANMLGVLLGADVKAAKNTSGNSINDTFAAPIVIEQISAKGTIVSKSGASIGGIVGKLYTSGLVTVNKCSVEGTFDLTNNAFENSKTDIKAGGIVGYRQKAELTMENCSANIAVKIDAGTDKNAYYGGLACNHSDKSTVKNCSVDGNIDVSGNNVYVSLYVEDVNHLTGLKALSGNKNALKTFKVKGADILNQLEEDNYWNNGTIVKYQ